MLLAVCCLLLAACRPLLTVCVLLSSTYARPTVGRHFILAVSGSTYYFYLLCRHAILEFSGTSAAPSASVDQSDEATSSKQNSNAVPRCVWQLGRGPCLSVGFLPGENWTPQYPVPLYPTQSLARANGQPHHPVQPHSRPTIPSHPTPCDPSPFTHNQP